jgi:excinuclease ABC subunit A
MRAPGSLTGRYLAGEISTLHRLVPRPSPAKWITVEGAKSHNLQDLTVKFPLGVMTVVTGVSGSGKNPPSSTTSSTAPSLRNSTAPAKPPGQYTKIKGFDLIDKAVRIDQSPIGRTPRSNPATYTGVFTAIRDLFAMLPESRERGYKAGRFSFNVRAAAAKPARAKASAASK